MTPLKTCFYCNGGGDHPMYDPGTAKCPKCDGEGMMPTECDTCDSTKDVRALNNPWGDLIGYICDNCAEAAGVRQAERDLEDPPMTLREQQIEAMKIKRGWK